MKKIFLFLFLLTITIFSHSQDLAKFHLYRPDENAGKEIAASVRKARAEGKHVFIQVGGNWCIWCARFNDFVTTDTSIDSLINANYIVYHLNWSKENRNAVLLSKYGFPQRFGFPVFLLLDGDGKLIHTQNSGYLEEGKGYSREKVIGFFNDWSPKALDPKQYTDQ